MMPLATPPPLTTAAPLQTDSAGDLASQQQEQQLVLLHPQHHNPTRASDVHAFDEARTDSDADRDDRLSVVPPLSTDRTDAEAEQSGGAANAHEATASASHASQSSVTGAPSGAIFGVVLQPLETLVALPEIERREFDSWDELHAHLTEYSDRTHQIYRTATSTPVSKRNAGIKPNPYTRVRQCIPETFRQYAKTIACTHAGVARHRTRGLRPERLSRCMGCPARMNACVKLTDRGWKVQITKHIAKHNHAVERDVFALYPENRRVTDPDVLRTVNVLRRVGTDPQKILQYIHEDTSARPTLDDVVNLLAKMKKDAESA